MTPREIGAQCFLVLALSVGAAQTASANMFCPAAVLAVAESVDAVAARCRPGDTIVLPAEQRGAIGRLCDFSRAIAYTGNAVVCVMAAPRPVR